jgi:hypothetical protein
MSGLTYEHFDAARGLAHPFDAIEWAWENQATVREMLAWSRLAGGDERVTKSGTPK